MGSNVDIHRNKNTVDAFYGFEVNMKYVFFFGRYIARFFFLIYLSLPLHIVQRNI